MKALDYVVVTVTSVGNSEQLCVEKVCGLKNRDLDSGSASERRTVKDLLLNKFHCEYQFHSLRLQTNSDKFL